MAKEVLYAVTVTAFIPVPDIERVPYTLGTFYVHTETFRIWYKGTYTLREKYLSTQAEQHLTRKCRSIQGMRILAMVPIAILPDDKEEEN